MIAQATTHSIWILEDHEVFAKQIRRLLSGEDDLVCSHHFTNAADLFDKLRFTNERPDLLLLDLGLPRRDGLEVLGEIRIAVAAPSSPTQTTNTVPSAATTLSWYWESLYEYEA